MQRFWSKLDKTPGHGPKGDCWLWTKSRNAKGYGLFWPGSRDKWMAHRYAWHLTFGEIPSGLFVCHRCDTPACCNPEHLFLGTAADNVRDMYTKGRYGSHGATLTPPQVEEIRWLLVQGFRQNAVAREFNVTPTAIGKIARNESWKKKKDQ